MNQREATKRYKAALEATRLCSTHKEQDEEYWGCMSCLAEKFYAQERERIIKLLEDEFIPRWATNGNDAETNGWIEGGKDAIALIKGEK